VSVLGFFRNRPDRHWWRTGLAPVLGLSGLGTAGVLLVQNFSIVTGTTSPLVNLLPWLLVLATIGGVAYALWMRANDPQRYASLAVTPTRQDASAEPLWPEPALVNGNQRYISRATDARSFGDSGRVQASDASRHASRDSDDDGVSQRGGVQSGRPSHA
jgi:hypothetical protein